MSSDVQTSSVTANTLRVDLGPLKVSPIGVGTWAWGDQLYWGSGGDEKVGKIPGQIRLNVESSKSGIDPGDFANAFFDPPLDAFFFFLAWGERHSSRKRLSSNHWKAG